MSDTTPVLRVSRRRALNRLWQLMTLVATGSTGLIALRFLGSRVVDGDFGQTIVAGSVRDFQLGTATLFSSGRFFLVRAADGGFLALYLKCTHLDCTLLWQENEQHFVCPCHGSRFDASGAVMKPPAIAPLARFPIAIVDGQVHVDTGIFIQRADISERDFAYAGE